MPIEPPKPRSTIRCWKTYQHKGARGLLINITGGEDMTLFEVDQAVNRCATGRS